VPKLILVYNADNGLFNAVTDTVHKIFSPSTYACSLCRFTYGIRGMIKAWSDYLESLDHSIEFLHRDEFRQCFGDAEVLLPMIMLQDGDQLDIVLSADEINGCSDLEDLISKVDERIGPAVAGA